MEQSKIERINFLAKKQKGDGLTPEEKEEQAILRREYIDSFKRNLVANLENTYIVDENGINIRLKSIQMTIKADLSCRLWAYEP
jgi:Bacterial protein of unknown function (DUF896)